MLMKLSLEIGLFYFYLETFEMNAQDFNDEIQSICNRNINEIKKLKELKASLDKVTINFKILSLLHYMVNYFLKSFDLMRDNVDKLVDIMRIKVDEVLDR